MSVCPTHPCLVVIFPLQMVIMSSLAAAVQGMDEAVINGAQIIYPTQFGIGDPKSGEYPSSTDGPPGHVSHPSERDVWLIGLVNSAPYLYVLKLWNQSHPELTVCTGAAQPFLAGCLIPSINGSAARKLFSSLVSYPSSLASGQVLPIRGGISSSLGFSLDLVLVPSPLPFPCTPQNVLRLQFAEPLS